jgi:protein-tyrosine phosphatase
MKAGFQTAVRRFERALAQPAARGRFEVIRSAGLRHQTKRGLLQMDISWLTDRVAVGGGIWSADNMAEVARAGITHVIDMQIEFDDTPLAEPFGIEVLWNATDDDFEPKPIELFQRGVEFGLKALDEAQTKLYIHCAAGVHRAPMMALALLGAMGWDADDAMEMMQQRRAVVDFAEVYVDSVRRYLDSVNQQTSAIRV